MTQQRNTKPMGIVWPSGSSADTVKSAFAASVESLDDEAASKVVKEAKWRSSYMPHFVRHVEVCMSSPEAAVQASRQGLDFIYDNFRFVKQDGQTVSVQEAMAAPSMPCPFETAVVNGTGSRAWESQLVNVPWSLSMTPGKLLSGKDLENQLSKAAAQGLMEPAVVNKIRDLNQNEDWSQKLNDTCFVILGAAAAMGPVMDLLAMGATVVAVDIPVPAIWARLIKAARASPGTLIFPVRDEGLGLSSANRDLASVAGCNIIAEAPEVLSWLKLIAPEKHHVMGLYAYADGADFPRVTLAMDAVAMGMVESRAKGRVSLAYLCSPTDVFGIPVEAREESRRRGTVAGMGVNALWQMPLRAASLGKILLPNDCGRGEANTTGRPVVDCFVVQQGPNYAFAKRLQHWRAVVAQTEGIIVSANVAPASHTVSVRKQKLLAAAYDGSKRFGVEIFHPQTSAALMTALMLHDVYFHDQKPKSTHPFEVFMHGAVHGGMWRGPYSLRSIVEAAAVIQLAVEYKLPYVAAAAVGAIALRAPKSRL